MKTNRKHIIVDAADATTRGTQRGEQLREVLPKAVDAYFELFFTVGCSETAVREGGERTLDALNNWRSEYAEEISAIAAASGLEPWQLGALNARTEVLASGNRGAAQECSTIAYRNEAKGKVKTFSVQTWDWHIELDPYWHTQETHGAKHSVAGLTEAGIIGKIGVNSAGLGTHFNILSHSEDGVGGVPMHVLAAAMLENCATVDEGLDFIRDVPVSASSAFTMIDGDRAVSVELSPVGKNVVSMENNSVLRTNHFLTDPLQTGEKLADHRPESVDRIELIESRFERYPTPQRGKDLLAFLYSDAGQAPLCAVPDMSKALGERWKTLATVIIEPAKHKISVAEGSPIDARAGEWIKLRV